MIIKHTVIKKNLSEILKNIRKVEVTIRKNNFATTLRIFKEIYLVLSNS